MSLSQNTESNILGSNLQEGQWEAMKFVHRDPIFNFAKSHKGNNQAACSTWCALPCHYAKTLHPPGDGESCPRERPIKVFRTVTCLHLILRLTNKDNTPIMMLHTFNPTNQEAETGRPL